MESHDIERIRRSLAMSSHLSPGSAAELIRSLERIQHERKAIRGLADDLARIAAELDQLSR